MNKVIFLLCMAAGLYPAAPQSQAINAPREMKAGDVVKLDESLSLKVTQAIASPFAGVKLKGEPLVVVIELDAGKNPLTFLYKLNPLPRSAEVYLAIGGEKLVPRAVIEDIPSFGDDNDKEVEVLDPKDGSSPSTLDLEGKCYISLLFDVPRAQARSPKKFSLVIRTLKPKTEQYSVVVGM